MISCTVGSMSSTVGTLTSNLSCTVLVPCWDAQGGEDFFGFGGQGVGGGELLAVEVDGDVLEGLEGTDDVLDADPCGLLKIAPELHRLGWFVFQSGVFRWDCGGVVVVSGH